MLPTGRNIPPWKHGNSNFEEATFSSYIIFSSPEHEGAVGTMRKKVDGRTKNILVFFLPIHSLFISSIRPGTSFRLEQ